MMDTNARTGGREDGCGDANVMGAYERDELNDNGERLLDLAADNRLRVINSYLRAPRGGARHTFQCSNKKKRWHTIDFILLRQVDGCYVRNVSIKWVEFNDSDHDLALEAFFEGRVRQLHKPRRGRDQAGYHKHLKGIAVEAKRSVTSQNIEDKDGKVLREASLITSRWIGHFAQLLSTKSPTLDPRVVDSIKQWPTYVPLDDTPSPLEVEERLHELARKKGTAVFACFVDLTKAYDSVDRELLWDVLRRFSVPPKMLAVIRNFHYGMRPRVRMDSGLLSDWFEVLQGLRQGCNLALLLVNLFFAAMLLVCVEEFAADTRTMEDMVMIGKAVAARKKTGKGRKTASVVVDAEALWGMIYAGIVSRSPQSLEKIMSVVVREGGKWQASALEQEEWYGKSEDGVVWFIRKWRAWEAEASAKRQLAGAEVAAAAAAAETAPPADSKRKRKQEAATSSAPTSAATTATAEKTASRRFKRTRTGAAPVTAA
eukprot:g12576.t1